MVSLNRVKLLFATNNQGKLKEAYQLLGEDIELISLNDLKLQNVVVEESGETLRENALIKAQAYEDLSQVLTLAEDSGLMVDALDGRPGVHSARFGSNVDERNQKLLKMLDGEENRSAKFMSVFCLYNPKTKKVEYFEGEVSGKIAREMKGDQGFGYDPLFIPDEYEKTFAELGDEVKNRISHRKVAIEKLAKYILRYT